MCGDHDSKASCPASAAAILAENDRLLSLRHVDQSTIPFVPIPDGSATCKLTIVRSGTMNIPTAGLISNDDGSVVGGEDAEKAPHTPVYTYLIERNDSKGEKVVFDLGLRQDCDYSNPMYEMFSQMWKMDPGRTLPTILTSSGIPLSSIDTIILGHCHVDHGGDLRRFPPSVSVLVGPDAQPLPELAAELDVPISTLEERAVRYLTREEDGWVDVGSFRGYDYWRDGSLYILDAPGHTLGHVAALVRTSANPPIYHLLGSDLAHDIGLIAPTDLKTGEPLFPTGYPRPLVALTPSPFVKTEPIPLTSFHHDLKTAYHTMARTARMEAQPNIIVLLAHDRSFDPILPDGETITLEGSFEELSRFKARDRYNHLLPEHLVRIDSRHSEDTVVSVTAELPGKKKGVESVVRPLASANSKSRRFFRKSAAISRVLGHFVGRKQAH